MSQYRITATITSQTQATDSGAWQMGITWRKSLTLDPAETQEAADLRNQAWEQAANGIDDETTRRIWQQVDTVTAREAERLRAQVRKLIGLLNAGRPALDENGYPMWDHLIALSNRLAMGDRRRPQRLPRRHHAGRRHRRLAASRLHARHHQPRHHHQPVHQPMSQADRRYRAGDR